MYIDRLEAVKAENLAFDVPLTDGDGEMHPHVDIGTKRRRIGVSMTNMIRDSDRKEASTLMKNLYSMFRFPFSFILFVNLMLI